MRDEHARLIRLCARLSGDADAADDLAQETLVEAWRSWAKLEDPAGIRPWLSAIARNVCRRWGRLRSREFPAISRASGPDGEPDDPWPPDPFDLELEIEREELVDLLDRALALLPPPTRDALVEKYVWERSQAEIAARLGLTEGAVSMRLQRGKLALRRVLRHDLRAEAAAYGLAQPEENVPQETRIWCPFCGRRRLLVLFDRASGAAEYNCPVCSVDPDVHVSWTGRPELLHGVKSFKSILSRQLRTTHDALSRALREGTAPCPTCGRINPVQRLPPAADGHGAAGLSGIYLRCPFCQPAPPRIPTADRGGFALTLPETQRFWRTHPRMHALPERAITYAGQPAVVTRYRCLSDGAALDVVSCRVTFEILAVEGPSHR